MRRDCREGRRGEENGSVSVRFEVDSDVVRSGGVVKMFDSSRNASYWYSLFIREHSLSALTPDNTTDNEKTYENICEVVGRSSIRVSRLNNSDVDTLESSIFDQIHDEPSS